MQGRLEMGVLLYCLKGGDGLTRIACTKKQCLNNKHGVCTASDIVYDGRCQTFTTPNESMRADVHMVYRVHGKIKSKKGQILR